MSSNVSNDLIWQVARQNSSYLVKRKTYGGVQFSSEPLNVNGVYTQAASGFVNQTAVGVVKTPKGIVLLSKTGKAFNCPASNVKRATFRPYRSSRNLALAASKAALAVNRDDLLESAVSKASTLARARKSKKVYAKSRR